MADRRSLLLNWLYQEARARARTNRRYLVGPSRRINVRTIALAAGVSPSQLSRIIHGTTEPGLHTLDALRRWAGISDEAEFYERLQTAPPIDPSMLLPETHRHTRRRR